MPFESREWKSGYAESFTYDTDTAKSFAVRF
jgi:hypothetical protein